MVPQISDKNHGIRIADKSFVARKFHTSGLIARTAVDSAALNLRMATMHLAGLRVPPRVRTIPNVRRRLPVTIISGVPEVVAIRHSVQTLGSQMNQTPALRDQRV
jgi:hypothetical protein